MIVEKYGVTLIKLRQEDVETLRQWRNSDKISRFMEYREVITPEMQQSWFDSLNPLEDFYFIIQYQGTKVGMIHTSGINWEEKTGNAGLFLYEDKYMSTHVPVLSSLNMVDLFFNCFKLERMYAKVMKNNAVARRYNENLGFRIMKGEEEKDFQQFELTREKYFECTPTLVEQSKKVEGDRYNLKVSNEFWEQVKDANVINEECRLEWEEAVSVNS